MEAFLHLFSERRPLYEEFTRALHQFFDERLRIEGVRNSILQARTKTVASFAEKLTRPGKHYKDPFAELSDLSGIRIIVCYTNEISLLGSVIEREFLVKEVLNKSADFAPNTFGYLSVHYVVSVTGWKLQSRTWSRFSGLTAEIQLRTQLQHSWAVVSHALHYKRDTDVPAQLRRRLFRLAGLFELADQEFLALKNMHEELTRRISEEVPAGWHHLSIDIISISRFIEASPVVSRLTAVARNTPGFSLYDADQNQEGRDDRSLLTEECRRLEIGMIGELEEELTANEAAMTRFLGSIATGGYWNVTAPFLVFLCLIASRPDGFPADYLVKARGWAPEVATRVLQIARCITLEA